MNKPSDELFNLIKSLTSEEKRIFKRFSNTNNKSVVYLKTFDTIDSLKEYDEKKLIALLKFDKNKNNLPTLKNYLSEAIYNFLEYHHSDHSIDVKIQRMLQRTDILFSKRLFNLARKSIKKAEDLAIEHHRHLQMIDIITWKHKILWRLENKMIFNKFSNEKYQELQRYFDLYKTEVEFEKNYEQVTFIISNASEQTLKKDNTEINEILKKLVSTNNKKLSITAQYKCNFTLAMIYLYLKKSKKSYVHFKNTINYFETAKIIPDQKLTVLSRFLMLLQAQGKTDEILNIKKEVDKLIENIPANKRTRQLQSLYTSFTDNYIDYHLEKLNLTEALSASDKILNNIEKFALPNSSSIFYANRFLILFLLSNYQQALRCANKVLSLENKGGKLDVISDMKLFYFIVHYELGNIDLLNNLYKSFTRSEQGKQNKNSTKNILIPFLGKMILGHKSKEKKKISFIELQKKLSLAIDKDNYTAFDINSWVESKIQNRKMIEILKEKLQN